MRPGSSSPPRMCGNRVVYEAKRGRLQRERGCECGGANLAKAYAPDQRKGKTVKVLVGPLGLGSCVRALAQPYRSPAGCSPAGVEMFNSEFAPERCERGMSGA